MKKNITIKVSSSFYSRAMNMKRMIAALLVYKVTHHLLSEQIDYFLITNDFFTERYLSEITKKLSNQFEKNDFLYALFERTLIEINDKMNFFFEPIHFKDSLQREKNMLLVSFCKRIFNYSDEKNLYRKFCNFSN